MPACRLQSQAGISHGTKTTDECPSKRICILIVGEEQVRDSIIGKTVAAGRVTSYSKGIFIFIIIQFATIQEHLQIAFRIYSQKTLYCLREIKVNFFMKIMSVISRAKFFLLLSCFFFLLIFASHGQSLRWASRFGSFNNDEGCSITTDKDGNVYTTGWFMGTADFDPGNNWYNLVSAGGNINANAFIQKLDSQKNFIWAKRLGGMDGATGRTITVDDSKNVFTTGEFYETADFDPGIDTFNLIASGGRKCYISKLDSNGNFLWAKTIGGIYNIGFSSIKADLNGNLYLTGGFKDTIDFDPDTGVYILPSAGGADIFILKLNGNGNFVWAKRIGDLYDEASAALTIDLFSNIIINGTADFDPNGGVYSLSGYEDVFILKLDSSGNFIWAKSFGGPFVDAATAVTIDSNDNVYTTGYFRYSADFNPDTGVYSLYGIGQDDIFISKLDSAGTFVWAKSIGGISMDEGCGIMVDQKENVYTTGYFADTADFDPGPGFYSLFTNSNSNFDGYISKLDINGNFVWARKFGGNNSTYGIALAIDPFENIYVTGMFSGVSDFYPPYSFNLYAAGGVDIFIAKYGHCYDNSSSQNLTRCNDYLSPSGNHLWSSSGFYTDTISNIGGCDSVININLTITSVDTSVIQIGDTIKAIASTATYQWIDCNNNYLPINGETGKIFIPSYNGSFAVKVIENGCTDTSNCYNITSVAISNMFINEFYIANAVSTGVVYIVFGEQQEDIDITIIDSMGQKISKKKYINTSNLDLDFPGQSGIYFIKINSRNKGAIFRIVKLN
jgi:hypothetical protein